MKLTIFILSVLAMSLTFSTAYGDDNQVVAQEYLKVQTELNQGMAQARRNLKDLGNDKKKAILTSQSQAKLEQTGIEALKKYDLLITVRYTDDSGLYQPSKEISQKDQDNINKLFDMYLRSTPLLGRTSVSHARQMIEWGVKRLEELAKLHAEPTDLNNPEMQIISKLTREAELKIKTVTDLAARLGVKMNEVAQIEGPLEDKADVVAEKPTAKPEKNGRSPASKR